MFDVIMFIIQWIVDFIKSLNNIRIPSTNLTLLTFFLSVLILKTIFGFLFSFLRMEKQYREKDFKNRLKQNYYKKSSFKAFKDGQSKYNKDYRGKNYGR